MTSIPCRMCDATVGHFGDCCADCQAEIDAARDAELERIESALDTAGWEIKGPASFAESAVGKILIALAKEIQ